MSTEENLRKLTLEYLNEYLDQCRACWKYDHDPNTTEAKQHLREIRKVRKYAKENLL